MVKVRVKVRERLGEGQRYRVVEGFIDEVRDHARQQTFERLEVAFDCSSVHL